MTLLKTGIIPALPTYQEVFLLTSLGDYFHGFMSIFIPLEIMTGYLSRTAPKIWKKYLPGDSVLIQ